MFSHLYLRGRFFCLWGLPAGPGFALVDEGRPESSSVLRAAFLVAAGSREVAVELKGGVF